MNAIILLIAIWGAAVVLAIAMLPWTGMLAVAVALAFRKVDWWIATVLVALALNIFVMWADRQEQRTKDAFWIASLSRNLK